MVLSTQEHDSDKFAAAIISMQCLLTRVTDATSEPDQTENTSNAMSTALHMIMETTRKELDDFVHNQPPEVKSNRM